MAPMLASACLLGLGAATAAALPGSLDSLLAGHPALQDASALVQVSVALRGHGESTAEVAAAPSSQLWPAGQWQDDLTSLEPGQPHREIEKTDEALDPVSLVGLQGSTGHPFHGHTDIIDQPTSRVLVYPPKKLAFCYIEKNAGTQFNKLFNRLNRVFMPFDLRPHILSSALVKEFDVEKLTRAAGWKWAVFLRDPLVRYLSAWGSKCLIGENEGDECLPWYAPQHNASVEAFEGTVLVNFEHREPLAHNPHYASQSSFCGGLKGARDYDFVGVLRGDVNSQVREMFRMVGANGTRVDKYVDELFPPHSVKGHQSSLDPAEYYRRDDIRHKVEEMYAEDYELPGLRP